MDRRSREGTTQKVSLKLVRPAPKASEAIRTRCRPPSEGIRAVPLVQGRLFPFIQKFPGTDLLNICTFAAIFLKFKILDRPVLLAIPPPLSAAPPCREGTYPNGGAGEGRKDGRTARSSSLLESWLSFLYRRRRSQQGSERARAVPLAKKVWRQCCRLILPRE